jgi:hypothetical protein
VEDHHVDRPGVEAQQCAKLTGTNRSFGLIQNFRRMQARSRLQRRHSLDNAQPHSFARFHSDDLVVMARGHTSDPIPNSAVKTLSANDTAS